MCDKALRVENKLQPLYMGDFIFTIFLSSHLFSAKDLRELREQLLGNKITMHVVFLNFAFLLCFTRTLGCKLCLNASSRQENKVSIFPI